MSWFLKNKKKKALFLLILIVPIGLCLLRLYYEAAACLILESCVYFLNKHILHQIKKPLDSLSPQRPVSLIDTLIIGDMCSAEVLDRFSAIDGRLSILAPERSLYSSSTILFHTASVLVYNIVILDVFLLHTIYVGPEEMHYGIKGYFNKSLLPLFFKVLKLLHLGVNHIPLLQRIGLMGY